MTPRPLIAGNWKMNGLKTDGLRLAKGLLERLPELGDKVEAVVCPPYTLLAPIADLARGSALAIGGQDCHPESMGAFTGDVSAAMLADLGLSYVIVGHSERRAAFFETDQTVRSKALAASAAGLAPILCVGESGKEREEGATFARIEAQIDALFQGGGLSPCSVVAYEPVWAIGSGKIPELAEIAAVHAVIRARLALYLGEEGAKGTRILYGGSVNPGNARGILALPDVDGGLIGGASLKLDDFWSILQTCP